VEEWKEGKARDWVISEDAELERKAVKAFVSFGGNIQE